MKKKVSIVIAIIMCFVLSACLAACSGRGDSETPTPPQTDIGTGTGDNGGGDNSGSQTTPDNKDEEVHKHSMQYVGAESETCTTDGHTGKSHISIARHVVETTKPSKRRKK